MPVKYVFVTGGVVSGLGKGITAASLGRLLKSRGYSVTMQKFDPYINIDPGTMNPIQHGEVFVTDDGAETDLDLGHYERFIDENLTKRSNVTTGKIYWSVIQKERRGDFGGGTEGLAGDIPAGHCCELPTLARPVSSAPLRSQSEPILMRSPAGQKNQALPYRCPSNLRW